MALITCTECGKEISSKAITCPNCGCPLSNEKFKVIITGFNTDTAALAGIEETFHQSLSYEDGLNILNSIPYVIVECDTKEEVEFFAKQLKSSRWGLEIDVESPDGKHLYIDSLNKIKCPSCNSTNISNVGTVGRMVSVGLFGLASSKVGKTHKCNNCGTTW